MGKRLYIEKLVSGGSGLARTERGIVLVEGSVPGETVEADISGSRRGVLRAHIKKIITPSPDRREPPCPYAGECGGCDWQHITYQQQVRSKHDILIDCLRRIGKISDIPPIEIITSPEWNYRTRAQFQIDSSQRLLGFFKKGSHKVIAIDQCPVLCPALNTILRDRDKVLPALHSRVRQIKAVSGIDPPVASYRVIRGLTHKTIKISVAGRDMYVSGRDFFQANGLILEKFVLLIKNMVSGTSFMDIFGGVGLFSLFLGDRFKKGILVEIDRGMAARAAKTLSLNHMYHIQTIASSAEDFFSQRLAHLQIPDLMVLNPPRTGLTDVIRRGILKTMPRHLLYVSCNPSTLARDLGLMLSNSGYCMEKASLVDLYPQTHHMETVVLLRAGVTSQ
ncbi:MAG: TRAM domain-containing protein [Nitrospiraceae bacterium]|nr:TRAM domain-containing protein [Nitrospiraceae bacterium]